ncbi:MAG: NAD(P)/FAD-dependent oxidoreductase [Candidatus Woesearchaeota archaeon]
MITIVGAGPVGSFAALNLSKLGHDVQILEEHKRIGLPLQCTGIVTASIKRLLRVPKSVVVARIAKTRIHSTDHNTEISFQDRNLVLDRQAFDEYLAGLAMEHGAKILLSHRFEKFSREKVIAKSAGKLRQYKTEVLIGADGPLSQVARASSLWQQRSFWLASQARCHFDNDMAVDFYPSSRHFAWVVPESSSVARIGVLSRQKPAMYLNSFLQKLGMPKVIGRQAGLVPIFQPQLKCQKDNIFLVGDSALQVKATTGGGIIPGLAAAKCLAYSLHRDTSYQHLLDKYVNPSLRLHLLVRKTLDRFNQQDYDRLVTLCSSNRVKGILSKVDRDTPRSLLISLLKAEPRLLFFAKVLLRNM